MWLSSPHLNDHLGTSTTVGTHGYTVTLHSSNVSTVVVTTLSCVHVYVQSPPPFFSSRTHVRGRFVIPPPVPVRTRPFRRVASDVTLLPRPPDHVQLPLTRQPRETTSPSQKVVFSILLPWVLRGTNPSTPTRKTLVPVRPRDSYRTRKSILT